jgi:hypothetical protein
MTQLLVSDPQEIALLNAVRLARNPFNKYPPVLGMCLTVTSDGVHGQMTPDGWATAQAVNTFAPKPQEEANDEDR